MWIRLKWIEFSLWMYFVDFWLLTICATLYRVSRTSVVTVVYALLWRKTTFFQWPFRIADMCGTKLGWTSILLLMNHYCLLLTVSSHFVVINIIACSSTVATLLLPMVATHGCCCGMRVYSPGAKSLASASSWRSWQCLLLCQSLGLSGGWTLKSHDEPWYQIGN